MAKKPKAKKEKAPVLKRTYTIDPTKLKCPEFYFDAMGSGYWLKLPSSRFLNLGASDIKLHLRHAGYDDGKVDFGLNPVEFVMYKSQIEKSVSYAGPLGGHRIGKFSTSSGETILITQQPRPDVFERPKVKPAPCPFIETFLNELLGPEQMQFCLYWLKLAVQSLRDGEFKPGQLVALAGPSQCGKSFFHFFVTELLGGRSAKAHQYMMGKTPFNRDLAEVEHLVIEDEQSSTNTATRREFGNAIKQMTVNVEFRIHGKGKQAITLPNFRRVTLSVNDEPENLAILPPLDNSIIDKIMLFKCRVATNLSNDYKKNRERLRKELPAFVAQLDAFQIPKKFADNRFGVKAYLNPELVNALSDLSPEVRLMNLIDEVVFKNRVTEWVGSADALERQLRGSDMQFAIEALVKFSSAVGVYLERLTKKMPERFDGCKNTGKTIWTIQPPVGQAKQTQLEV